MRVLAIGWVVVVAVAIRASAQEVGTTTDNHDEPAAPVAFQDEVVVTAANVEQPAEAATQSVRVLGRSAIEWLPTAPDRNLAELLA